VLAKPVWDRLHTLELYSIIEHTNEVLPPLFRLTSLPSVVTLRFKRGVSGTPKPELLAQAWPTLERIELVDTQKTFTRGSPEWPDTRPSA
jgi:hypothetical protein